MSNENIIHQAATNALRLVTRFRNEVVLKTTETVYAFNQSVDLNQNDMPNVIGAMGAMLDSLRRVMNCISDKLCKKRVNLMINEPRVQGRRDYPKYRPDADWQPTIIDAELRFLCDAMFTVPPDIIYIATGPESTTVIITPRSIDFVATTELEESLGMILRVAGMITGRKIEVELVKPSARKILALNEHRRLMNRADNCADPREKIILLQKAEATLKGQEDESQEHFG